jgi:mRNA-degrading endonuclease YafQ of YafQ-DinJ toxin-antitoxin module
MNKLEKALADEVFEKIEFFKNKENHKMLKVHKLHGRFSGCFSFSIDYKTRIIFKYETRNEVVFLAIGDHDLYK